VMLVVRGNQLVPARGSTVLQAGDHVYIVAQPEDRGLIQLMFGQPEEE
jgi:cell volume regulation protein A